MHGDYTRDTFGPTRYYGNGFLQPEEHFTRVLLQQGRPLTDADWNEQSAYLLEATRSLARTLIGWHGSADCGFKYWLTPDRIPNAPTLCHGHYYVDGIRCEHIRNEPIPPSEFTDWIQGSGKDALGETQGGLYHLVYLDVWEQSVTGIEHNQLREPALTPIETSTRSRTRWALRVADSDWRVRKRHPAKVFDTANPLPGQQLNRAKMYKIVDELTPLKRCLKVRINQDAANDITPCVTTLENGSDSDSQSALYRVEIHRGGPSYMESQPADENTTATFKWSRENGAAVFAIKEVQSDGQTLKLRSAFSSHGYELQDDDWIEILDQYGNPVNREGAIVRIKQVCDDELQLEHPVTPGTFFRDAIALSEGKPNPGASGINRPHFVRRWFPRGTAEALGTVPESPRRLKVETRDGAFVHTRTDHEDWIELENGIEIQFSSSHYQRGDYWLIDVRRDPQSGYIGVASLNVADNAAIRVPNGPGVHLPVRGWHVYAPIGYLSKQDGSIGGESTFRKSINPSTKQYPNATSYPACPEFGCLPDSSGAHCSEAEPDEPVTGAAPAVRAQFQPGGTPVAEVLSEAGVAALRGFFKTPREVLRRIPVRYLKTSVEYSPLAEWLKMALMSQVVNVPFETFDERFQRTYQVPDQDRELYERDVKTLLQTAHEFSQKMATESGMKTLRA